MTIFLTDWSAWLHSILSRPLSSVNALATSWPVDSSTPQDLSSLHLALCCSCFPPESPISFVLSMIHYHLPVIWKVSDASFILQVEMGHVRVVYVWFHQLIVTRMKLSWMACSSISPVQFQWVQIPNPSNSSQWNHLEINILITALSCGVHQKYLLTVTNWQQPHYGIYHS